MSSMPRVVIVGRTNVGKSTLFNRLAPQARSITYDIEGVTRDYVTDIITWRGCTFELIDTGGVSLRKTTDPILKRVREDALKLIESADLILFMCDAKVGLLPEDREIASLLYKIGKPVFVVVNKVDSSQDQQELYEFEALGFDKLLFISASHGTGVAELLEVITDFLPASTIKDTKRTRGCNVVILGKPNVGKSSLMNLLLNQERTIVADMPGTTREPITEQITFYQQDIQVTDTPGIRRKRSIKEPLETMMVKTSFKALDRADIVLLVIDASEGHLSDQELKLAFYALDHHKGLILLFNKQDLVDEYARERLAHQLELYPHLMHRAAILSISCKTDKNVGKVLPLVDKICKRYGQEFDGEELSLLFKQALVKKPLHHKTEPLILHSVRQISTAPITILLTVNISEWFGSSQLGFFENLLRKRYDLQGVPVKFVVRKKPK